MCVHKPINVKSALACLLMPDKLHDRSSPQRMAYIATKVPTQFYSRLFLSWAILVFQVTKTSPEPPLARTQLSVLWATGVGSARSP